MSQKINGPMLERIFPQRDIFLEEILFEEAFHDASLLNPNLFVHIDPKTDEWRHALRGASASETALEVYKVLRNGNTVMDLFKALNRDTKSLFIEQSQIAKFMRIYGHSEILNDCRATLFLTEVKGEACVVEVRSYPGIDQCVPHIFSASVHHIWRLLGGPTHRLQIVVPVPRNK